MTFVLLERTVQLVLTHVHEHRANTTLQAGTFASRGSCPLPLCCRSPPLLWSLGNHWSSDGTEEQFALSWPFTEMEPDSRYSGVWLISVSVVSLGPSAQLNISTPFCCSVVFHCMEISQFVYLFTCWWTFWLSPVSGHCKLNCCEHSWTSLYGDIHFSLSQPWESKC